MSLCTWFKSYAHDLCTRDWRLRLRRPWLTCVHACCTFVNFGCLDGATQMRLDFSGMLFHHVYWRVLVSVYRAAIPRRTESRWLQHLTAATLKHNLNILHCLQYSRSAWECMSSTTVKICWRKAGFHQPQDVVGVEEAAEIVEMVRSMREAASDDEDHHDSGLQAIPPKTPQIFNTLDIIHRALYVAGADGVVHRHFSKVKSTITATVAT